MHQFLQNHIPKHAFSGVINLLDGEKVSVKVKSERKTKHGDYRKKANGDIQITINANLNPYRFLITLLHEIAHLKAFNAYGRVIKPHGIEWKYTFKTIMLPFLRPQIFPSELLPLLANHFKNPKASSDTDVNLALALKQFDPKTDKSYIFEIPIHTIFEIYNGKRFKKGKKRIKRYECIELKTGRVYLFNPNAEVNVITT